MRLLRRSQRVWVGHLVAGWVYEAGATGSHSSRDPLHHMLPVGVAGGIRWKGRAAAADIVALTIVGYHPGCPDTYDLATPQMTYFGDNRAPGYDLHKPAGDHRL